MKKYIIALRPWSFPVTLSAILLGALAYKAAPSSFSISHFLLSLLGALSVHAFGNLVNTYADFVNGLDTQSTSDDRAIVDGHVTVKQVKVMIFTSAAIGLGVMSYFLSIMKDEQAKYYILANPTSYSPYTTFLLLVSAGIFLAYSYTGSPFRFKYRRLGDIIIVICFGPLLLLGAYFVQLPALSSTLSSFLFLLYISLAQGLLTESHGAYTLARSLGDTGNYLAFIIMLLGAYGIVGSLIFIEKSLWFLLPFVQLPLLPTLLSTFRLQQSTVLRLHPQNKKNDDIKNEDQVEKQVKEYVKIDLCEKCGQFSAGFGILLSIAIWLS